jgi:hypothetical protein
MPISLFLSLSKIFEKCIKFRLMTFLNEYNYFFKNQFGFLHGKSTTDAHFTVNNFIHENLDANRKVMDIFLDVKKSI